MARIRSLHPGLFTDERYMGLSFPARELIKGIWCEADDDGVFDWKPLTLKARIIPADAVNMDELLAELEAGHFVRRYEFNGHQLGAVRNFRSFQRPKKPNSRGLLPRELRTFVGLIDDGTEPSDNHPPPVPHQFPTSGVKSPQMEDEGRRVEDKEVRKESTRASRSPPRKTVPIPEDWLPTEAGRQYAGDRAGWPDGRIEREIEHFRNHHRGKDSRFVDLNAAWRTWVLQGQKFDDGRGHGTNGNGKSNGATKPNGDISGTTYQTREDEDRAWDFTLEFWIKRGCDPARWMAGKGTPPGHPMGCSVPDYLLKKYGLLGKTSAQLLAEFGKETTT